MKPEERKAQILRCARKLFAQHGYYQTQIADILKEANVSRGTIYKYFANKDDIFITLLENYYHQWEDAISLTRYDIDIQHISPADFLRHRIRQSLIFFSEEPDMCSIVLRVGLGLPGELELAVSRFWDKILNIIHKDLNLARNNRHIVETMDLTLTANLLVGAVLQAAYHYFGGQNNSRKPDIERVTDEIAGLFIPGLFIRESLRVP